MQYMIYEKRGNVSWIIFNRPERLNALDRESWDSLSKLLKKANEDDTRVIVLTGNGRAFSSGDDIYAMYELKDVDEAKDFFLTLYSAIESLTELEKPLICAVNGLAYGGGCEILLFCDVTIAVQSAKFSIPEAKLGLIPPMAITIGPLALGRRINRLVLTGEAITAEEAKILGLVDYVVPDDKLIEEVNRVIEMINQLDFYSLKTIKRWLRKDKKMVEKAIMELALLSQTESAKKRMKEFIDSRKKT
ncbi:enoyl-CoA hydratase/isomerase family protein [Sulfurisphaera ohwakuensis]|uniref:Enoyl-CoA hydratase/isomerase family protein n=2 Tax=Sulfurisphaera ohwakuensis TaxID=69656 RepID=A0A650CKP8_SULOH|nr:enoyl-CoA hydratase/isomerase family protein [Sulfurisphaera ohwakuensis]QGR18332.1 enoyl-CoA hydratase/isomerase family protein [Sulfurisphaera ohwakuensis]